MAMFFLGLWVAVSRTASYAEDATWPFLAEPVERSSLWQARQPPVSSAAPSQPVVVPRPVVPRVDADRDVARPVTGPGTEIRPSYPSGFDGWRSQEYAPTPSRVTSLKRRPPRETSTAIVDATPQNEAHIAPATSRPFESVDVPVVHPESVVPAAAERPIFVPQPLAAARVRVLFDPPADLRPVTLAQPGLPVPVEQPAPPANVAPAPPTGSVDPLADPEELPGPSILAIPRSNNPLLQDTRIIDVQATIDTPVPTGNIVPEDYADALGIGPPIYDNPDRVLDWMRDSPGPDNYVFWNNPLYFEDANLERQGCGRGGPDGGVLQTLSSAAYFFGTIPILPYKIGAEPPCSCVPAKPFLGPCRCYTWRENYLPPWSARGAALQAVATTGLVFIIP